MEYQPEVAEQEEQQAFEPSQVFLSSYLRARRLVCTYMRRHVVRQLVTQPLHQWRLWIKKELGLLRQL